ncbi:MAG: leucyl aminopeptidase [Planctomycetes bacterium]|nr:leucyl aminopeptidase [Planctomycetota bacterium]
MKLTFQAFSSRVPNTHLLALPLCEGEKPHAPQGVALSKVGTTDVKGEWKETRVADASAGPARRVLFYGLGKKAQLDVEKLRRFAAASVQRAEALGAESVALLAPQSLCDALGAERVGVALAEGARLGAYRFDEGKSKPKERKLASCTILSAVKGVGTGVEKGLVLAEANSFARDLQNRPANLLTPRDLAAAARSLAKAGRIAVQILDEVDMKKMGMGLLLGVAQGSRQPPRLVHLSYKPKGKSKGVVALVGKGLTFDSGGISIKPSAKMDEMRYDMSGAAAVLGAFHALRKLDVPWEVHGVCACSENMPGGAATKPGDIHTAMNGTTVEVLNTDAEGRLVLADALCYVNSKIKPDTVIDLATLTGAVVVALGHELSGMFASTDRLRDELLAAGEETGERLWPLPLLDVHKDAMKGQYADLKNISGGDLGAGSSAGAAFLAPFVGEREWAHLDIAGTAWGGTPRDWVGGPLGSGVGARMLVRWLETR